LSVFEKTLRVPKFEDLVLARGHRGGVIPMHRALSQFQLIPLDIVTSILILVFFSGLWTMLLPWVCQFWNHIFGFALSRLPLHARLESVNYHLKTFQLSVPSLRMEPIFPSIRIWTVSCATTIALFVLTFVSPRKWLPIVYLGRTILLVHASALAYFALLPASFPHTPNSYLEGLVTASLGLISVIPVLFALTYYIFDFGLLKKSALTALTMAHLVIFVPLQVLLQALILQQSILFMPVLYIIFGLPIDILLIISFYSWAMTWPFRQTPG
jgi:hypothetical protein